MTKVTRFPEGLDNEENLPDIEPTRRQQDHDIIHTAVNQAIIQLQKKVGKNEDPNPESIDFRVKKLEESGGGGSGLAVGDEHAPLTGENENIVIPAHPSVWLEAVIEGARYVVPGYRVGELLAPEDVSGESANLFRPVLFRAHEYIQQTGN